MEIDVIKKSLLREISANGIHLSTGRDLKLKYDTLEVRGGGGEGFAEIRSSRQTWKVYIIKASGSIFSRFHVQAYKDSDPSQSFLCLNMKTKSYIKVTDKTFIDSVI